SLTAEATPQFRALALPRLWGNSINRTFTCPSDFTCSAVLSVEPSDTTITSEPIWKAAANLDNSIVRRRIDACSLYAATMMETEQRRLLQPLCRRSKPVPKTPAING